MKSTTKAFWKLVSEWCAELSKGENALFLDGTTKNEYITNCDNAYDFCKTHNMKKGVRNLDRHKIASILVIEAIKLGIVKRKDGKNADNDRQIFIGVEKVLFACAINYLAQQVNLEIRKDKKDIPVMQNFPLPMALSCSTGYDDITCRLLHYGNENNTLSILDLADKFFLLEYIAINTYYGTRADEVFSLLRESAI